MADDPVSSLTPGTCLKFSKTGELMPSAQECIAHATAVQKVQLPHERYAGYVQLVAAMTLHGYRRRTIAAALGVSVAGIEWCQREARRRGELKHGLEHALQQIDEEAVPLAVESLLHHLRNRDKDVTMKVLSGKGMFPHLTKGKEAPPSTAPPMAFQFNFTMPDGAPIESDRPPAIKTSSLPGEIVGEARVDE